LEINRTVVVCLPTYISMHRTRVEFTLGTSFARFPRSLDGVFLQGETYLTDTLPRRYSHTNPNLASDPLRQASRTSLPSLPSLFTKPPRGLSCSSISRLPLFVATLLTLRTLLQRLLGGTGWSYYCWQRRRPSTLRCRGSWGSQGGRIWRSGPSHKLTVWWLSRGISNS